MENKELEIGFNPPSSYQGLITDKNGDIKAIPKTDTVNGRPRWQKFTAFCITIASLVGGAYLLKDKPEVFYALSPSLVTLALGYIYGNLKEHQAISSLISGVTKGLVGKKS